MLTYAVCGRMCHADVCATYLCGHACVAECPRVAVAEKKKAHVREGVLPRLLREILSARVAVKKLMKVPPFAPVFALLYQ